MSNSSRVCISTTSANIESLPERRWWTGSHPCPSTGCYGCVVQGPRRSTPRVHTPSQLQFNALVPIYIWSQVRRICQKHLLSLLTKYADIDVAFVASARGCLHALRVQSAIPGNMYAEFHQENIHLLVYLSTFRKNRGFFCASLLLKMHLGINFFWILGSLSTFRLFHSYESKKVSGRFPDVTKGIYGHSQCQYTSTRLFQIHHIPAVFFPLRHHPSAVSEAPRTPTSMRTVPNQPPCDDARQFMDT